MSEKPQIRTTAARLSAAGMGAALSFILFSAYILIPPAGLVSGLLAPFPAVFCRLRHGRGTALIATLATTAMMASVFGIQAAVLYLVQCSVIGLLMPELLVRGFGAYRVISWTTAVNLVVYLLAALVFIFSSGHSVDQLHQLAVSEINGSITQAAVLYEKAGIKGDELAAMKQSMATAAHLLVRIYPALMTMMLIIMTGCNVALVKRLSNQPGFDLKIGEFKKFRNPDLLVWLLIADGFALLAGTPIITTPALNLLVILALLYFLQGMAVVSTFIARQSFAGMLRVGLYLMLLFQPYLAAVVAAIGIFDLWGDFRTPRKQENL
jgi:uncharacterized protein YybS (DUF2232 family)